MKTSCDHCQKTFTVKDEYEGKNGKCPGCKETFVIMPIAEELDESALIIEEPTEEPSATTAAETTETQNKTPSNGAERFLLIDDNPATRALFGRYITKLIPDATIHMADDGPEGIEKFKTAIEANSPYHLIFLDFRMPEMNGVQALTAMREISDQSPIIMRSANIQRAIKDECLEAGAEEFLGKPVRIEKLAKVLTRVFDREIKS